MDGQPYWEMLIRRGLSRFFLLAALYGRPAHGYELARRIKEVCRGCCQPTDATIYPTLRELLEGGYIECRIEEQGRRRRKVCALTPKGIAAYRAAARAWGQVLPPLVEAVQGAAQASDLAPALY